MSLWIRLNNLERDMTYITDLNFVDQLCILRSLNPNIPESVQVPPHLISLARQSKERLMVMHELHRIAGGAGGQLIAGYTSRWIKDYYPEYVDNPVEAAKATIEWFTAIQKRVKP